MTGGGSEVERDTRFLPVAAWTHTLVVVGIFVVMAAAGALLQGRAEGGANLAGEHPAVLRVYASLLVAEWALLLYVRAGIGRRELKLEALVEPDWSWPAIVRDVVIAAAFWGVFWITTRSMGRLLDPSSAKSISTLLPHGALQSGVWIALSVTAGICEEVVFRGYLLRQARALLGNPFAAVIAQALVFGIAHGYQGWQATVTIALDGILFGLLALWRRSLVPGMIAHAWADIFAGLLAP